MGLHLLSSFVISAIIFHTQICASQSFENFGFGYMGLALKGWVTIQAAEMLWTETDLLLDLQLVSVAVLGIPTATSLPVLLLVPHHPTDAKIRGKS